MPKFLQILCTIMLVAAAAQIPQLQAATVETADGLEIDLDRSDSSSLATIDELRALDHQITSLFRISGRRLPRRCRVKVTREVPPGELRVEFKPREWLLTFNDQDGLWRTDFRLWRRLTGLILLSKIPNAEEPLSPDYLPGWIAAGIASRMQSSKESELLLSKNRYFPVLRALAEQGKFPDFRQMRLLTPELLAPPAMGWYRELGRVLLEYGAELSSPADNALLDYCLLAARPGSIEEQNFKASLGRLILAQTTPEGVSAEGNEEVDSSLSAELKIQRALERYARQLAFNEFFPQPARMTRAAFEEAMTFELPVLGPDGKPTGETTSAELASLPELLPGRQDAPELKENLRRRLLALGPGNDRAFLNDLAGLVETLRLLPLIPPEQQAAPSPCPEQFRRQIEQIRAGLERREAIENELAETEFRLLPPGKFYAEAIEEAKRPSPVLSAEAQEFLERVETEWIGD